jgi:hypothetical protein
MALLTPDQAQIRYQDGNCDRTALVSLLNVSAADTVDLVSVMRVVKRCGIVSATGTTIAGCSITGTVVTIPAGPTNDGVWLLAVGVAA